MKISRSLLILSAGGWLLAGAAHAAQIVQFTNVTRNGIAVTGPVFVGGGDAVKFDALLTANGAANPPGTLGLGLCLEYQRAAVNDPLITNVLSTGLVARGAPVPLSGCTQGGSPLVEGADFMVVEGWAALTGGWPNLPLPVKLYGAQFTVPSTPAGTKRIGFGASAVPVGETFLSNGPLLLCAKPTVTVVAGADGSETGPAALQFAVVLSTAVPAECGTAGGLSVTLSLGGSATVPGQTNADYTIGGSGVSNDGATVSVTFPADGATTMRTVTATPIADDHAEGTETVTLTIDAGNGNYAGVGNAAMASILDGTSAPVVVEYLDTVDFPGSPGGHFFYSSDPAEQAAVDAGAAGQFSRTGRQFATGGASPVCRFYGSLTPGPNSHFFTVEPAECDALRAAQVVPTPATVQQWNFEGIAYSATPPVLDGNSTRVCPANTLPIYRAYNNAFPAGGGKNPWDSNHRFTPLLTDIVQMVAVGWRDEGIAFCTPQ
ncbi:MAG: hypothetical protein ABI831_24270 [Betaproteobacteria bacterium]